MLQGNWTKLEEAGKSEDPFQKIYEDEYLNFFLLCLYTLGLVSCFGLCLVSWYEKSGQAGSYRSLVNQLVSMRLDQLVLFYTLGTGSVAIRRIVGPLPMAICRLSSFFQNLTILNSCHLTILIVGTRFSFIYIFKSVPAMDDKLLSTFIMLAVNLWSLLATLGKMYTDEREAIPENICSGTWQNNRLDHQIVPLVTIVMTYTLVIYIILSIAIQLKKKRIQMQPVGNYNNGNVADLSDLVSTFLSTLLLGTVSITFGIIGKFATTPAVLVEYPLVALVHVSGIPCLFGIVSVQAIYHFWTNKKIRKAAWRLFFHEQMVVMPATTAPPTSPRSMI